MVGCPQQQQPQQTQQQQQQQQQADYNQQIQQQQQQASCSYNSYNSYSANYLNDYHYSTAAPGSNQSPSSTPSDWVTSYHQHAAAGMTGLPNSHQVAYKSPANLSPAGLHHQHPQEASSSGSVADALAAGSYTTANLQAMEAVDIPSGMFPVLL